MKKHLTTSSIVGKALNAYAERRRHDPGLPRPVSGEAVAATVGGRLAVVLPLIDGTVTGYSAEPTFRLVRLSSAQLAPYRRGVEAPTRSARVKRLIDMVVAELAAIEHDAELANGHANGGGNGHANGGNSNIPFNDLADKIGVHFAAK